MTTTPHNLDIKYLSFKTNAMETLRIGATLTLGLTFAGQMLTAMFLDHYGAIGLAKYPASPTRIAGVVLVFLGVSLIAYAKR
ncbi:MAG: DMT family transporter [Chamaesiphon sp.]|nr:DMT family transporter [Chamaesiphon sp.]